MHNGYKILKQCLFVLMITKAIPIVFIVEPRVVNIFLTHCLMSLSDMVVWYLLPHSLESKRSI